MSQAHSMQFDDLAGFLQVYGWGMTLKQATKRFHSDTVAGIAKRLGVVFRDTELHVRGLEHLPGLPGTATVKTWAGGTTYRIPTDCPGIPSITIHNASTPADDGPERFPTDWSIQ